MPGLKQTHYRESLSALSISESELLIQELQENVAAKLRGEEFGGRIDDAIDTEIGNITLERLEENIGQSIDVRLKKLESESFKQGMNDIFVHSIMLEVKENARLLSRLRWIGRDARDYLEGRVDGMDLSIEAFRKLSFPDSLRHLEELNDSEDSKDEEP